MKKKLKMRCKRSFALLLALAMCLGTTPGIAFASEDVAVESSDSSSSDNSTDSGSDTGSDSGTDSGSDTGSDSGTDSGSDTGSDSGTGSGSDTGSDSGTDSGSDTGSDTGNDSSSNSESDTGSDSNGPDGSENNGGSADSGSGSAENTDKTSDADSTTDNDSTDDTADDGADNSGTSADGTINADGGNVADSQGNTENAESGSDSMDNADSADPDSFMADTSTDGDGGNVLDVTDGSDDLGSYNVSLSEEVVLGEMQFSVLNVSKAASSDAQIRSLDDDVPVEDASSADDTASEMETDPAASGKAKAWDITQTERPDATKDVEYDKGTADDKLHIKDKNWDIFYDADEDVYKVTFNIKGEADDEHQIIDLTKALELLGQYAESGKQALEDAKNEVEKPVKEDAGKAPEMGKIDVKRPELPKLEEFNATHTKPEEPGAEPKEPGKPEGLDEKTDAAFEAFAEMAKKDPAASTVENAKEYLEKQGLDGDDAYLEKYAKYMMDSADVAQLYADYQSGDLIDALPSMGLGWVLGMDPNPDFATICWVMEYDIKWTSGHANEGDPYVPKPEYLVDKTSQEYQDYLVEKEAYDAAVKAMEDYEAAFNAFVKENKLTDEAVADYYSQKEAYEVAKAKVEAEYEAALAAYNAKKADIEKKYADDKAVYDAEIAKLEKQYESWAEANVLQPGDIRKFELYLTSDSKHTYKYQSGSFTLATPELKAFYEQLGIKTDGLVVGFDGQKLGGTDVRPVDAAVSFMSKPMLDLFTKAGIKENEVGLWLKSHDLREVLEGWYDSTTNEQLDSLHKLLGIEKDFSDEELRTAVEKWVIGYYSTDGKTYKDLADLVANDPQARAELSSTTGNAAALIGGSTMSETLGSGFNYNNFYQSLFGFAFGDDKNGVVGITDENGKPISMTEFLGKATLNPETGLWEYGNKSWTNNGYQMALYYYMDHQEIWEKADTYFKSLLNGGLSAKQATWTSLMMAVNIDGALTGNGWQDTKWPWYSSIKLDRMDIDFNLTKKDGETNETITNSETEFQVYYIDKVTDKDGKTSDVKMYCTYDPNTKSYTFVTTPSTVWTDKGELNISYAMMKDIVYYLQEMTAPEGYELDTNVYIIMSEEDYRKLSDEEKAELEGTFDKFLNTTISKNGLNVSADFINVKIVTPENPGTPTTPSTPSRPRRDRDTTIPNEPTPLADIPEAPVPLASIPDEDVPLAILLDEDVPLASVPKTGDISSLWFALLALSGIGLLGMAAINGKKSKESASN